MEMGGGGALAAGLQGLGCLQREEKTLERQWLATFLPLSVLPLSSCDCRRLQGGRGIVSAGLSDGCLLHVGTYMGVYTCVAAWL